MSRTIALLLVAALAAGCGDPYAQQQQPDRQPPPGEEPAHPLPKPRDRVRPEDLAPTPEDAARRAAELTTNWTGENAARTYAQLARISVGAARREALDTAARLPTDPQLSADGTRSTGTVEAITARPAVDRERRELIVVTRESLTADGLQEHRWRVTLATARRRDGGWALSRWEPQP
ncbi:MAG TPA: hypothetical protein VF529_19975 [Solirubrobacteraceae bacterium]|jgi:hypothetical protein